MTVSEKEYPEAPLKQVRAAEEKPEAKKPAPAPERAEKERCLGLIAEAPDDGYTLRGECVSSDPKKPKLPFTYRPALPEAIYEYRLQVGKAEDGVSRWKALVELLVGHIVTWEVYTRNSNGTASPVPFSRAALMDKRIKLLIGVDYFDQLSNHVNGYIQGEWEQDAKN